MKDTGQTTSKMDMEYRNGQMVASIRENLKMAKNMEKEFMFGLMVVFILEDGNKICCTVMENTNGKMGDTIKDNG